MHRYAGLHGVSRQHGNGERATCRPCCRTGAFRQQGTRLNISPALRRAGTGDIGWIAGVSRQEIEQDLPWSWTPPRVRQVLAQNDTNAFVASVNGTRAGFSIATLGPRQSHLVLLAVLPDWRRLGIGNQLLNWQLESACTAGIVRMSLEVRARNRAARIFYQQQGFRFERNIPGYYSRREDAVKMTLAPLHQPDLAA